jgi:hypothetical protein
MKLFSFFKNLTLLFVLLLRLGVGINNAFLALFELGRLIESLVKIGSQVFEPLKENFIILENILNTKEATAQERMDRLVQFQLSTMYYESYCDLAIFFDKTVAEYWKSQQLFKKERKKKMFLPLKETDRIECSQ